MQLQIQGQITCHHDMAVAFAANIVVIDMFDLLQYRNTTASDHLRVGYKQ